MWILFYFFDYKKYNIKIIIVDKLFLIYIQINFHVFTYKNHNIEIIAINKLFDLIFRFIFIFLFIKIVIQG